MRSRKDILLKVGLLLLVIGALVYFRPFHTEPMWMEWVVGPALIYLGLPLTMVGMAIHFFGDSEKSAASLPGVKTRG
jgi:hypothetical protein